MTIFYIPIQYLNITFIVFIDGKSLVNNTSTVLQKYIAAFRLTTEKEYEATISYIFWFTGL